MKTGFLILTLFLSFCFSANSQADPFQQDIVDYLNSNGTREQYSTTYEEIFLVLKKQFEVSNVPDSVWKEIKKDKEKSLDGIINFLTFAYRRHFTRNEIQQMHRFYQSEAARQMMESPVGLTKEQNDSINAFSSSDLGKKIEEKSAALSEDIEAISQHWSRDLFGEKMSALVKKGYYTAY
jgi:hypothetical protein